MIKKYFKYLMLLAIVYLPNVVLADAEPVSGTIYSKDGVIGSEVVFELFDCNYSTKCSGTITYNPDELEFISIKESNPDYLSDIVSPTYYDHKWIEVKKNTSGMLQFDYNLLSGYEQYDNRIVVTFKVKAKPGSGVIKINFEPASHNPYGGVDKEIKIISNDETQLPTSCNCSQEKQEDTKECNCQNQSENNAGNDIECKTNNFDLSIPLIVSLVFNGLFLVLLISLFLNNRKLKKSNVTTQ